MSDAPRISESITPGWVLNKIKRLATRLWRRDFIRRRPRFYQPPDGVDAPSYSIAYNTYGAYCVPNNSIHRPAARAVMAGRIWEEATLKIIAAHIAKGDVVHAGTFFGDFLPFLATRLSPEARLWSFEPNRGNFNAAKITVAIGGFGNIELINAGLGAQDGSANLVVKNNRGLDLGGASFISTEIADAERTDSVRVYAIDKIVPAERHVSVIQLDIEGFEEAALTGALDTIARCRPLILVETAPSDEWFKANLAPLGYRIDGEVDENTIFRSVV